MAKGWTCVKLSYEDNVFNFVLLVQHSGQVYAWFFTFPPFHTQKCTDHYFKNDVGLIKKKKKKNYPLYNFAYSI